MYEHLPTRVVVVHTLRGDLDPGALTDAFHATVARHPTLCGTVVRERKGLRLCTSGCEPPELRIRDDGSGAFEEEINTLLAPGDLVRGVLLRGESRHRVILQLNHAFSDGRSALALGHSLWQDYAAGTARTARTARTAVAADAGSGCPQPVEASLGNCSDADVTAFLARQAEFSDRHRLATIAPTADAYAGPGGVPDLDVQRLRLDRVDTEGVLAAAKKAGIGVHAFLCGALLSNLRPWLAPAIGPTLAGCMSAVDLRARLGPPLPDDRMVLGASWFTGVVELTGDDDPVALGRDYEEQLRRGIANGDPELSVLAVPRRRKDAGVLRANLSVSNLGSVPLPPMPQGLELADIRAFGAPDRDFEKPDDGRLRVVVLTLDGRMHLDIAYDRRFFSPTRIREFLDSVGALLRLYVEECDRLVYGVHRLPMT